ncbi:hypothetical protein ACSBR1_027292 [Camellia fascicularis]
MQFWLQIGGLYWFLFPSPCTLNRQFTSQRAQGIQLCPKVNKIERELLKQEELDAQRLFLGNAKARKFPRSTLTSQVQSQTIRSSDVPRSVTVSIDNMFHVRNEEEVDRTIARCLYSNGITFNVMRSPCLDLLKVKKTRFGHLFIVLQRLVKHDIVHQTIMDDDFWRKAKRVLTITKHIYKMLRFSDSDKAVIKKVYELMDTMLGNIKDTHSNDPIVYDLILQFVVERWDKMNIPLHCLAYILVPKYYTNSWLSKSAPGGVRKKKPHFDVEVQKGATMDALSWWHLYGGAAPELYSLALKVLSQRVNTSFAERCWSTYSYIHNDAYPEDANIEEDIMAIEERDNVSLLDNEDDTTLVASDVQPCPTPTPLPTFSSFPLPTSQEHSVEQVAVQRRLEKARGKRQKK